MAVDPISWTKHPRNPIVPVLPGTWREKATMTADILTRDEDHYFYYTGKGRSGADSIGLAFAPVKGFAGTNLRDVENNPLISPGASGAYDAKHCVDPAAVEFGGKLYLYYSAIGDGPDCIGLAISDDWRSFRKYPKPVLTGRAPEVVRKERLLHLFYVLDHPRGGYEYHVAVSEDGVRFEPQGPVFSPTNEGWDSFTVVTGRIFLEGGIYILSYAGDHQEKDYPKRFGLAFSRDLRSWKRYPHNPVFQGGAPGSWESKAIWFPEILKADGKYYMYYEGNNGSFSQIGLATCVQPLAEIGESLL